MSQVLIVAREDRVKWLYTQLKDLLPNGTEVVAAYNAGEAKDFLSPEPEVLLAVIGMFDGRTPHTFGGPDLIRDIRDLGHTFPVVVVSGSWQHNQEAIKAGADRAAELQSLRSVVAHTLSLSR